MTDALALAYAQRLISCESVTPAQGAVFDALEDMLKPLGFRVDRFVSGTSDDNMIIAVFGPIPDTLIRWLNISRSSLLANP